MKNIKTYISQYNACSDAFPSLSKIVITPRIDASRTLSYFKEFYKDFKIEEYRNKTVIQMAGIYSNTFYSFEFVKL